MHGKLVVHRVHGWSDWSSTRCRTGSGASGEMPHAVRRDATRGVQRCHMRLKNHKRGTLWFSGPIPGPDPGPGRESGEAIFFYVFDWFSQNPAKSQNLKSAMKSIVKAKQNQRKYQ